MEEIALSQLRRSSQPTVNMFPVRGERASRRRSFVLARRNTGTDENQVALGDKCLSLRLDLNNFLMNILTLTFHELNQAAVQSLHK